MEDHLGLSAIILFVVGMFCIILGIFRTNSPTYSAYLIVPFGIAYGIANAWVNVVATAVILLFSYQLGFFSFRSDKKISSDHGEFGEDDNE
ncbi:MAG: hypothetical protein ABW185_29195 [Sedimenticola sp.]